MERTVIKDMQTGDLVALIARMQAVALMASYGLAAVPTQDEINDTEAAHLELNNRVPR